MVNNLEGLANNRRYENSKDLLRKINIDGEIKGPNWQIQEKNSISKIYICNAIWSSISLCTSAMPSLWALVRSDQWPLWRSWWFFGSFANYFGRFRHWQSSIVQKCSRIPLQGGVLFQVDHQPLTDYEDHWLKTLQKENCEKETVSNQKVILVTKNDEIHQAAAAHLYSVSVVNQQRFSSTLYHGILFIGDRSCYV